MSDDTKKRVHDEATGQDFDTFLIMPGGLEYEAVHQRLERLALKRRAAALVAEGLPIRAPTSAFTLTLALTNSSVAAIIAGQ